MLEGTCCVINHAVEFSKQAGLFLLCRGHGAYLAWPFQELCSLRGAFGNLMCAWVEA